MNQEMETNRPGGTPGQLTAEQDAEARRVAGELVKLHKAGAISGPEDPEARFYACLLHTFEGEFIGKREPETDS
jgi:hypothetical protein